MGRGRAERAGGGNTEFFAARSASEVLKSSLGFYFPAGCEGGDALVATHCIVMPFSRPPPLPSTREAFRPAAHQGPPIACLDTHSNTTKPHRRSAGALASPPAALMQPSLTACPARARPQLAGSRGARQALRPRPFAPFRCAPLRSAAKEDVALVKERAPKIEGPSTDPAVIYGRLWKVGIAPNGESTIAASVGPLLDHRMARSLAASRPSRG